MNPQSLVGKTISEVSQPYNPRYADRPHLQLMFTDGTVCLLTATYSGYTQRAKDEYPCYLLLNDKTP